MIAEVAIVLGTVGAVTTLAVYAIRATRREGNEKARADALAVRLEARTAERDDLSADLANEQRRTHALDAAIADFAARAVGPVDGSAAELLQAANAARDRASRRADVHDAGNPGEPSEADRRDPDGLLRPGE